MCRDIIGTEQLLGLFIKMKMETRCYKRMTKNPIAKDLRTTKYKQRIKPNKKKRKQYKEVLKEMIQSAEEIQQTYKEDYKKKWEDD